MHTHTRMPTESYLQEGCRRARTHTLACPQKCTCRRVVDEHVQLSGRTGTLIYMSPEVYRSEHYNEKVRTCVCVCACTCVCIVF